MGINIEIVYTKYVFIYEIYAYIRTMSYTTRQSGRSRCILRIILAGTEKRSGPRESSRTRTRYSFINKAKVCFRSAGYAVCHIPVNFMRNFGLSPLPSKSQDPFSSIHAISNFSPGRISLRYSASTVPGCAAAWTGRGIRSSVRSK